MPERTLYESREASYSLDPTQLFNVVADLSFYLRSATHEAEGKNPPGAPLYAAFRGEGRILHLGTEVKNTPNTLSSFTLADLIHTNDSLTLVIYPHETVTIPSSDLHGIAEKYRLK